MLKFIGGSVLIVGAVSASLYLAGYWSGSLDITLTDNGRRVISEVAAESKRAIDESIDSLQESVQQDSAEIK